MTRYLLAAATVAGALSLASPAAACDFDHCVKRPVCNLLDCDNPPVTIVDPVPHQCIPVDDLILCF